MQDTGSFTAITGPMFSGKTDELIRKLERYEYAQQSILIFKPKTDSRNEKCVASRNGDKRQAIEIENARQILETDELDSISAIGIDEAQFFDPALADVAETLIRMGIDVVISGLDTDFRGEPFATMARVLAKAQFVEKLDAVCMKCKAHPQKRPAVRSQRLTDHTKRELIGDNEEYEARCFDCFEPPE
jgi:thymidine kinase